MVVAKETGINHAYGSKYDKWHKVKPQLTATKEEFEKLADLRKAIDEARRAEDLAMEETTVRKEKQIKVVKGRKVPIGTTGKVFWVGETQWGRRIGFKDSKGETHWTAIGNVIVI